MGKCHKPGLLWFSETQPLKGYQRTSGSAAKSLQSCPTLCNPIDGSPPGSSIAGTLQARTLEWIAISFSNSWKWKVKVKSLSRVWLFATPWTATHQAPPSMGFSRQEYWSGVPMKQTNPLLLESRKAQDTTGLHCESVLSGKTMGETVTSSRVLRDKSRWGKWAARTEKQLLHTCGEAGSLGPWGPETHPRNSSKGTCYRVKKTDTRQFLQTLPKLTDVQFSSVQLRPTLCNPMNRSTPGLPVHHQLPEFTQTHVHWVSDAIQPSHPLLAPSPPALNLSSIRVFSNESTLRIRWPKYWSCSFSISPSNGHPGLISFRMDWLHLLAVQGTLKSLLQHHSSKFFSAQLSL